MAVTKFSLCSQAFIGLGANTISDFDVDPVTGLYDSNEKTLAATRYDSIKRSELSGYQWSFCTYTVELSREVVTPPAPWTYQFLPPSDMLRIVRCEDTSGDGIDYELRSNKVYSDSDRVLARYMADVDEDDMPPYFQELMVARLRWEFSGPIRDEGSKQERALKEYQLARREARRTDAQSNPPSRLYTGRNSTWLAAHRSGG